MILDNPIFTDWYTDTVDVYRTVRVSDGTIDRQERKLVGEGICCRVYSPRNDGPSITENAARSRSQEKMAVDLETDIRAGDELYIVRGGALGCTNQPERYIAGDPVSYYDPVGGALTGLEHMEVGLLKDNLIGG